MKIENNRKKIIMLFMTFLMIAGSLMSSFGPTSNSVKADERSAPVKVLCMFEDGEEIARIQSTDYLHYLLRSKSAITSRDGVNSIWLNKILTFSGFDFDKVNQDILGREIKPSSVPDDVETANEGPKVSAFDRFGVAGLKWSSYQGEWKYYHIDVCSSQQEVSPTNYGEFYENRKEPLSTHGQVSLSKDPRSIQFNKGAFSSVGAAAKDLISNFIFGITKLIVTLTIGFVGLAFTDITSIMGLSADGTSGPTAANMFTDLFNTAFSGFVLIAILMTTGYLIYNGLIKRQFRLALNTILKTIGIFIVAIVMSTDPGFWIGVPNKVATYGQAMILSSMAGIYDEEAEGQALCTTEVAEIDAGVEFDEFDESSIMSDFEKVNKNMRSMIGCQMWEQLLFKPWVRGQFGSDVDYEDLDDSNIENINESWVGNASVPIGGGETIDNWALFHLSTQTDAHAQVGNSNFPTIINGVNADWWRTVDAMSNYDEEEKETDDGTYMGQVDSDPLDYWQSWIGNNSGERFGTAIIAFLFGIAGSVGPMVLSIGSAVYGFGITLLMIMAPFFLMLGLWAGRGEKIFLGWLSTLLNTVIKRILISILLILSITISMSTMNLAYSIGIIKAFLLMVIVTSLLIKNRTKLLNMVASVDFGGTFNPSQKATEIVNKQKQRAKQVRDVGVAGVGGAVAGHKTGQGAAAGAMSGMYEQGRDVLYQSELGRETRRALDIVTEKGKQQRCTMCGVSMGSEKVIAYRDDNGNYYCEDCANELGVEDLHEVVVGDKESVHVYDTEAEITRQTRTSNVIGNRSYLNRYDISNAMNAKYEDKKHKWDQKDIENLIQDNMYNLNVDLKEFDKFARGRDRTRNVERADGRSIRPSQIPVALEPYIDVVILNELWSRKEYDAVRNTYRNAWKLWYEENAEVRDVPKEEIAHFKKVIEEYNPEISEDVMRDLHELKELKTGQRKRGGRNAKESSNYVQMARIEDRLAVKRVNTRNEFNENMKNDIENNKENKEADQGEDKKTNQESQDDTE